MQRALEYEQHAKKCREMAAQTMNPKHKKDLEGMAEVWDMLARERREGIVEYKPPVAEPG
ncbi:MAG: hypothetical protein WCD69_14640 [Xanthobacteraceae bacterium]